MDLVPNATTTSQVTITRFSGAIPLNAGPDQDLCSIGVTGLDSTTMAATAIAAPGSGTWTVVSGSATIANASSPTTAVSNIHAGVTTLRWTISNGPCTPNPNTDDVVIRVFNRNAPVATAAHCSKPMCTYRIGHVGRQCSDSTSDRYMDRGRGTRTSEI